MISSGSNFGEGPSQIVGVADDRKEVVMDDRTVFGPIRRRDESFINWMETLAAG